MSKDWYTVDVREKVFEELKDNFLSSTLPEADIDDLKKYSTRELMDGNCLNAVISPSMVAKCRKFVIERFYYYRNKKYGNKDFWYASSKERDIVYHNQWYTYIRNILSRYCKGRGNVLFVGTANGSEIPFDDRFNFFALEQLENSVNHIDRMKCLKIVCGDFEDEKLLVEGANCMDIICALRCMTPNTRIERFLRFADLNLKKDGAIVMSHPMGYLDKDGMFKPLPDSQHKLDVFRDRLHNILHIKMNYILEKEEENRVESFFFLNRTDV